MTFPLDIRTEINLGGAWTDISPDVYQRDTKQITRGVPDQASAADPSSLTLTLNNRDGKYSPRNAESPLFGLIGRNTPLRVSLPAEGDDNYLQLDGATGNYVSTPDTASLDIVGDLDVRAEIAPDWYGPSNQILLCKWDRPSNNESWMLQLANDAGFGRVYFRFSTTGEVSGERFFSQPLPQLPARAAIRATLDVDNGAGGNTVTFYWAESLDAPDGWTLIGHPVVLNDGITTPPYSSAAELRIGSTDLRGGVAAPRYPLNGRGYRFEVRNGINGSVVASPDFRALAPGSSTLTDSKGLVWTLKGAAEVRDREDRFCGEVSTWPNRWSVDDADRYVPITANGLLRRLGQGAKALDSTLRRRIPSGAPTAYWPMEEAQDAVQAFSPIPGVSPASVSGVEWASDSSLPSSAALPKLTETSALSASVPAATPGAWQVEFVYNANDNGPATDAQIISYAVLGSAVKRWVIEMRMGIATISGYSSESIVIANRVAYYTVRVGADVFHGWNRLRFWATDLAGGGFQWRISWQDVGGDSGNYSGVNATGSCGYVSHISAAWPAALADWSVGHLTVLPTANNPLMDGSDDAFLGEDAWARLSRLAREEGFNFTRTPGALDVERVGYQRSDALLNLFEDASDADGGLLTEDMSRIGLHYRDRSSMYSQTPLIEISYNEPGLGPDIEPVDDDTAIRNDVTVSRDGGSSGRAVLEDGPLSIQPAPVGIGKYDASYTLCLADDKQTSPLAYWRLHQGTADGARYPQITFLLHKPGAEWLIPLVRKLREGDKIRITDMPKWVSADDVELIVMGWSETLDLYAWTVTLNCVPSGPWDTAVTDHALYGIADTDGSILTASATATDTTLSVRTLDGPTWADDAGTLPYYVRVAGEVMQVTAISNSVADTFTRTVATGWGSADTGQAWTNTGGSSSDYSVSSGTGKASCGARNSSRFTTLNGVSLADTEVVTTISAPVVATGSTISAGLRLRSVDTNNYYYVESVRGTNGRITLQLVSRVAAVSTVIAGPVDRGAYSAGEAWTMRARLVGSSLSAKLWRAVEPEPYAWDLTAVDTSLTAAGPIGTRSILATSNTNTLPVAISFDDFQVVDTQTFTVTRSVNGVVKAQPQGTAVNVETPAITSL